ncbi:MAG: four helix bundle protein [Candidatus Berkelbacteria bacterium]|nr:four helix bundle protein [Candidatus Berkelbacteria bacterium]
MNNYQIQKKFDLENRTTEYGLKVIRICKMVPRNPVNDRITGQLAGCSGLVGANYREANDSLGKKDFLCRLRIVRKEAKEAIHWLILLREANNSKYYAFIDDAIQEGTELKNIFSTIISKCEIKL